MNKWIYIFISVLLVMMMLSIMGKDYWEQTDQMSITSFLPASAESRVVPCVANEETRERIKSITIDALDEALHDQIKLLFQSWMKDDRGQPERAGVGIRQAINAHQEAKKRALEWSPVLCAG